MLKIVRKIILGVVLCGGGFWVGSVITSGAEGLISSNQPGSINDPMVTKSYVDKHIAAAVKLEMKGVSSGDSKTLTVVELNPGQSLIAFEGTEFIVRNGKAISFSNTTDGIPDLTDGTNLVKGTIIPKDHLLLFPRNDGRGIKPHESQTTTIFVMVRGKYQQLDINGNIVSQQ